MTEPILRRTSTHASDEYEGVVLGIPVLLFKWVALALLAGVGLFLWLYFGRESGFGTALKGAVLPPTATMFYLRMFHIGKPQGYFVDWLETRLFGGHAVPPNPPPPHPLYDLL